VKFLVTYFSVTGNTRKVAETIFHALPGEKELKALGEVISLEGYDRVFIGFPVMQFGPPREVRKFAQSLAGGKRVALFVTHAMATGTDDPVQRKMLETELGKCRDLFPDAVGFFHCKGELSVKTASELTETGIPMLMEFAGMRPLTLGHPTTDELYQARIFALSVVQS